MERFEEIYVEYRKSGLSCEDAAQILGCSARQFSARHAPEESAFVPVAGFDIGNILCIQEERVVAADNTASYRGLKLQIPPSPRRHHFIKAQARDRAMTCGLTGINSVNLDARGIWRGSGSLDGKPASAAVDFKGNAVVTQ